MFLTAFRLASVGFSMMRGARIDIHRLQQLVGDALHTVVEFGSLDNEAPRMLGSTQAVDPTDQLSFLQQAVQRQTRWLRKASPYYQELFAQAEMPPAGFTLEQVKCLPLTKRRALQKHPQRFLATGSRPFLSTRTTGTTGCPLELRVSTYELELWGALLALGMLMRNEYGPGDCFQLNLRLQATAAVQVCVEACRLLGAQAHVLGIVDVDTALDNLLRNDAPPTVLHTYGSYLALLVQAARRRGLSPRDFRLRHIQCVGEILSPTLAQAAQQVFGPSPSDGYSATEIQPVSARRCEEGHLHFDSTLGLVEVLDPVTDQSATQGALGKLTITPFFPYRDCMPVFRYDTGDMVRLLSTPLPCSMTSIPATSPVQGREEQMLYLGETAITPRQIIEALESLPSEPFPVRYCASVEAKGIVLAIPESSIRGLTEFEVSMHVQAAGIPVSRLQVMLEKDALAARPVRADMLESGFSTKGGE